MDLLGNQQKNIEKASHALSAYLLLSDRPVCFDVRANTEAGNAVKQTLSVLGLKARARLLKQKKEK